MKQIREEIAKIDSLLLAVDADLERLGPEPVPPREAVEAEYLSLLSALSTGGSSAPFASLAEPQSPSSQGLDAFTFFGLLQAFMDDPIVISCLARIFSSVVGVTATQLEDSLLTVERVPDADARDAILAAIVERIVSEIETGKLSDVAIVAVCCQRLGPKHSESMLRLLETPGSDSWPLFVQVELCHYLVHQPVESELIKKFLQCVLDVNLGENAVHLDRNEAARSPRVAFQLIDLLIAVKGEEYVQSIKPTLTGYVEKCLRFTQSLTGQLRQASDLHNLAIQLARIETDASAPLWTLLMEKLSSGGVLPLYEVPGTLSALASIRLTADNLFANILSIKKRVGLFTRAEMEELVNYLLLVGDKSPGAAITKFLLERRDLFVPTGEDCSLLAAIVELAAVASVESGTVLPECVLLLKKYQAQIASQLTSDSFAAVSQLLLPNSEVAHQQPSQVIADTHCVRIQHCLSVLGLVADGVELIANGSVDGLDLDFVFQKHKICIVIERRSVFNVSSKRATVSGRSALKANLMAQRKSFRVIVVIPELYADDKALISLLADPLKKVTPNAAVEFTAGEPRFTPNQRMALFQSKSESLVDISRALYQMLKLSVSVSAIVFDTLVCGDQFLNLVLSEFLPTYVVKHKGDISVSLVKTAPVSVEAVYKVVDHLNSAGNASGGFGVVELKFGLDSELKNNVFQRWSQAHPGSSIKLSDGLNGRKPDEYNIIYLS